MTTIPRQLVQPGATSKQVGDALGRLIATARKNSINANQHEMKTDKELGEIGANAAFKAGVGAKNRAPWLLCVSRVTTCGDSRETSWDEDGPCRTAFAAAVREEVEKECNRSMQNGLYQAIVNKLKPILGENSRELEWDILPFTLGKLIAAKRIPDAGQAKKIGEQAEEIARLTAKSEKMCQAFVAEAAKKHEALAIIEQAIEMVNTLGTTKDNLPNAINAKIMQRDEFHDATLKKLDAANTEIARLTAELSNATKEWHAERDRADEKIRQWVEANAELERLRWRPIATAPNDGQWILTWRAIGAGGDLEVKQARWYPDRENFGGHGWTFPQWGNAMPSHWRPLCPPPIPTAEEKERAEFDKLWSSQPSWVHENTDKASAFFGWQAARASEEVKA